MQETRETPLVDTDPNSNPMIRRPLTRRWIGPRGPRAAWIHPLSCARGA